MTEATTTAPADDSGSKLIGTHMSKAQRDLIELAVHDAQPKDSDGKPTGEVLSKAAWLRTVIGRGVSAQLGIDWPADEPQTGPKDKIALAAEAQGMTRSQFVKFAALYAAGVPLEEAKAQAMKPHPLSKEEKAKRAAAEAAAGTPAT